MLVRAVAEMFVCATFVVLMCVAVAIFTCATVVILTFDSAPVTAHEYTDAFLTKATLSNLMGVF
jgi:hypothetical protein